MRPGPLHAHPASQTLTMARNPRPLWVPLGWLCTHAHPLAGGWPRGCLPGSDFLAPPPPAAPPRAGSVVLTLLTERETLVSGKTFRGPRETPDLGQSIPGACGWLSGAASSHVASPLSFHSRNPGSGGAEAGQPWHLTRVLPGRRTLRRGIQ